MPPEDITPAKTVVEGRHEWNNTGNASTCIQCGWRFDNGYVFDRDGRDVSREPCQGPQDTTLPQAMHSAAVEIAGVTVHVHVLDDGRRIIDLDDLTALFEAFTQGATPTEAETLALAKRRRHDSPDDQR